MMPFDLSAMNTGECSRTSAYAVRSAFADAIVHLARANVAAVDPISELETQLASLNAELLTLRPESAEHDRVQGMITGGELALSFLRSGKESFAPVGRLIQLKECMRALR